MNELSCGGVTLNCQLPDNAARFCGLELPPPPHAGSIAILPSSKRQKSFEYLASDDIFLKCQLQAELNRARTMRINRVQERRTSNAVTSAAFESGGIEWSGITADDVVSGGARIVRIVNAEL